VSRVLGAGGKLEGLPLVIDHHIFVRSVRSRVNGCVVGIPITLNKK